MQSRGSEEKQAALESEVQTIQTLLGERSIDSLVHLPVMTDSSIRLVMRLLTELSASSYILGDQLLTRLISATMVRLSALRGPHPQAATISLPGFDARRRVQADRGSRKR